MFTNQSQHRSQKCKKCHQIKDSRSYSKLRDDPICNKCVKRVPKPLSSIIPRNPILVNKSAFLPKKHPNAQNSINAPQSTSADENMDIPSRYPCKHAGCTKILRRDLSHDKGLSGLCSKHAKLANIHPKSNMYGNTHGMFTNKSQHKIQKCEECGKLKDIRLFHHSKQDPVCKKCFKSIIGLQN